MYVGRELEACFKWYDRRIPYATQGVLALHMQTYVAVMSTMNQVVSPNKIYLAAGCVS